MLWRLIPLLTLAGMVAFLNVRVEITKNSYGTITKTSIGLRHSPWYTYEEIVQSPKPLYKNEELTFLSWSWLCLLPGVIYISFRQKILPPTEAKP